jgi:hypothetical protein
MHFQLHFYTFSLPNLLLLQISTNVSRMEPSTLSATYSPKDSVGSCSPSSVGLRRIQVARFSRTYRFTFPSLISMAFCGTLVAQQVIAVSLLFFACSVPLL